ncbi:CLUMA_CG020950, isoform A [Clunio marinus]|uniref:CLUMA_CG020950, isoform A n=1 Tax=Clunio marinus TaxID=568069 RepID=A0A1J1J7G2_9DIPT|nr:CLUMA_CG020950, isoform A [Clunio marinus]
MNKTAHVITVRQSKGALSSLKKVKLPKNVLVKNEDEFWPCIEKNQSSEFMKLFEEFCSSCEAKQHISLGLQSCLRQIQQEKIALNYLIIAHEVSPRFFGSRLITLALQRHKDIKVIIVQQLRNLTKLQFKFPSIIICIKQCEKLDKIDKFYENLGMHSVILQHFSVIESAKDVSIKKKKDKIHHTEGPSVIMLQKTSNSNRNFISMDIDETESSSEIIKLRHCTKELTDFVSVNESLTNNNHSLHYQPMKIRKLAMNPNRKKKLKLIK